MIASSRSTPAYRMRTFGIEKPRRSEPQREQVPVLKFKTHIDAELSQSQLEALAGRLASKRRELSARIVTLEREIVVKDDCSLADAADAASLQENRLRARGMVEQHQRTIKEIDAAMRRIGNGSYGVSEVSGEPIAYERLLLVPWARIGADDEDQLQ
jgi:DnaK suppressor protein